MMTGCFCNNDLRQLRLRAFLGPTHWSPERQVFNPLRYLCSPPLQRPSYAVLDFKPNFALCAYQFSTAASKARFMIILPLGMFPVGDKTGVIQFGFGLLSQLCTPTFLSLLMAMTPSVNEIDKDSGPRYCSKCRQDQSKVTVHSVMHPSLREARLLSANLGGTSSLTAG
jgi:hypothetical protein